MKITKMQGAGNDMILINGIENKIQDYSSLALKVCDRHFGVGADGLEVCEKSNVADIKMLYYNSDGSRGEMCGNGIRCFAKYVYDNKIVDKDIFTVETLAGIKTIWLETENHNIKCIRVDMGKPIFDPKLIPVAINKERILEEHINVDGQDVVFSSVLVGVPHTVIFVDDIKKVDINELGRKLEKHPLFPKKMNVNFVEVVNRRKINIYTWERGAGRTLACGTGSCASVVIGNVLKRLDDCVEVNTEGGSVEIQIKDDYEIFLKGGAATICVGEFCKL